jgi:hypothetical protein
MRTRHLTVVGLLASTLAVGLITGCAQGTGTPSAGGSGSVSLSPSSPSPEPSSSPSSEPSSAPPSTGAESPSAGPETTLSGQVEAGVEASCLIMQTGGKTYLLLGGDKNIVKAGNNVVVRGHIVKGVMSYCMQGQPFQITDARLG